MSRKVCYLSLNNDNQCYDYVLYRTMNRDTVSRPRTEGMAHLLSLYTENEGRLHGLGGTEAWFARSQYKFYRKTSSIPDIQSS